MQEADAELYLPVSAGTLRGVLDGSVTLAHALDALSAPEIAALVALARLAKAHRASPERVLATAVRTCALVEREAGLPRLREQVARTLERAAIEAGHRRLPELGIALLDEEDLDGDTFLTASGEWDHGFAARHRERLLAPLVRREGIGRGARLTLEQSRVYRELEAQDDEHLHVQGYAGTGKSSLIRALIDLLEPSGARVLVLAEHQRQLDATPVDTRRSRHVGKSTFAALARRLVPEDLTSPAYMNMLRMERSRTELPDDELVRLLGIRSSGRHDAREVARAVRTTLFVFCRGADDVLDERHLPRVWRRLLDPAARGVVCQHARELWSAIVSRPSRELGPLIRPHHLIKWVALNRWPIPGTWTHVVVDESHDLPGAVRQILAASPQAVATLGDDYQNLGGYVPPLPFAVRAREMTHSVRTGASVEALVNPIIAAHPGGTKAPFHGNRMNRVEIVRYEPSRAAVPESPAAILVGDVWGLFEWVQRVASGGGSVDLMSERQELDRFVKDCIELHANGTRARHLDLLRFDTWTDAAEHHADNPGFQRIDRLLARGYGYRDWSRTYARLAERGASAHSVGLVGNALNREFDTVMLAPGVVGDAHVRSRAAFGSAMYVALTRARRRLIVPETLRSWIEEVAARQGTPLLGSSHAEP